MAEKIEIAKLNISGSGLSGDLKNIVKVTNLNAEVLEVLFEEIVNLKEQVRALERRSIGY